MNPSEERLADAAAFGIGKWDFNGRAPYSFQYLIRGLSLCMTSEVDPQSGHAPLRLEFDLVGVVEDGLYWDFEFKLGCARHRQANTAKRQLRRVINLGLFQKVWACWDEAEKRRIDDFPGAGLILNRFIETAGGSCSSTAPVQIRPVRDAPELDVSTGRLYEKFRTKVREFQEGADHMMRMQPWCTAHGPLVFLHCPACGPLVHYFYPVSFDYFIGYSSQNWSENEHAPFCEHRADRRRVTISNIVDVVEKKDGVPVSRFVRTNPLIRFGGGW